MLIAWKNDLRCSVCGSCRNSLASSSPNRKSWIFCRMNWKDHSKSLTPILCFCSVHFFPVLSSLVKLTKATAFLRVQRYATNFPTEKFVAKFRSGRVTHNRRFSKHEVLHEQDPEKRPIFRPDAAAKAAKEKFLQQMIPHMWHDPKFGEHQKQQISVWQVSSLIICRKLLLSFKDVMRSTLEVETSNANC